MSHRLLPLQPALADDGASLAEGRPQLAGDANAAAATIPVGLDDALRAVAAAESMEVTDDDLEREYRQIGLRSNQKADRVRRAYEQNDAVTDLVSMLLKNKALDWLVEHVEIVDTEGSPIERSLLTGERNDGDHDHHDHDHHDHDGHDHEH